MPPVEKVCDQCGNTYRPLVDRQRFCARRCKINHERATAPAQFAGLGLASATVGALNELRVCVDLMQRGWCVFRAQSPACPCDLVAFFKDSKPLLIEVRTAIVRNDKCYVGAVNNRRFDVLARVAPDRIIYEPDITIFDYFSDDADD